MEGDTLVLGIGNSIMADDGVGVHAVRRLQQLHGDTPNVQFVDGGCLSYSLTELLFAADNLIVIDASELHAPPGSVRVFHDDAIDRFFHQRQHRNVHEINLLDLFSFAALCDRLPPRRALIAVQPQIIDVDLELSDAVARAVPHVIDLTQSLIKRWEYADAY